MRKRLGQMLVERGAIITEQLEQALALQRRNGMRLGTALVSCGHLEEPQLVAALGELLDIRTVDLTGFQPEVEALQLISARFAAEHDLFPLRLRRERGRRVLTVAMVDPLDVRTVDELGFVANSHIETVLASASDVDRAIRQAYGPRLAGSGPTHPLPLRADSEAGMMTILRRGGGEEDIQTSVGGRAPAPPASPGLANVPVVDARPEAPRREDSAILLTEEVHASPPPIPPQPKQRLSPTSVTVTKAPEASLGALVDPEGQTVDAAAVLRLERRFWAMLRILSRKGLITKEEFMREIEDE